MNLEKFLYKNRKKLHGRIEIGINAVLVEVLVERNCDGEKTIELQKEVWFLGTSWKPTEMAKASVRVLDEEFHIFTLVLSIPSNSYGLNAQIAQAWNALRPAELHPSLCWHQGPVVLNLPKLETAFGRHLGWSDEESSEQHAPAPDMAIAY